MNRRDAFLLAAGAGLDLTLPRPVWAVDSLRTVLEGHAEQLLRESPEQATALGLDSGARAQLNGKLDDRSLAADSADHAACAARIRDLQGIARATLTPAEVIHYESALYANQLGVAGGRFGYGSNTLLAVINQAVTPYVVSQETGAANTVPEFLNSQHKMGSRADADAYLARLERFAVALDQETQRIRHDAGLAVVPPDFILDTALAALKEFGGTAAPQSPLVTSLVQRTSAAGFSDDYAAKATKIVARNIYPALERQLDALAANRAKAGHDAGVWHLPHGEEYYAWTLKVGTTASLKPDEAHSLGLEQTNEITSRMDVLLKDQGLTSGSVAERMGALAKDPRNLFADSDAGRTQLIEYLNSRVAVARGVMPKLSALTLRAEVTVKRVPAQMELGAPLAYMNSGSLDGSRPSIYYINLQRIATWPRFTLPSLSYHETIPGHLWQGAFVTERHTLPLFNTLLNFNAYVEGWALYAEQLADEVGLYAEDPLGRLGYLQLQLLRACRLVVDTGLHSKRWPREKAITWMASVTGHPVEAIASEVDRYCVVPGQACGYKVGQQEILRLRSKAQSVMQGRFDLRGFNDAVVSAGPVPLTVLARAIDNYAAGVG